MQRPPNFSLPPPNMPPPGFGGPRPPYQSQYSQQSNPSSQPGKRFVGPDVMFDGKRMRKAVYRKTVDYNTSVVNYLENRIWQRDMRDQRGLQPDLLYCPLVVPPPDLIAKPMNCVTTRFIRTSMNKIKCPIFCVCWTPEGRRLITGASSGEFTLWNGLTFNFETILQAHDSSVRAMQWSPNDQWMLTGDHNGFVKYWQSNMNNVKMYQAHKDPIRGLSFCPTNSKFASCSDDGTVRIWDFLRCHEEKILRGHGADVKCVDWHPQKALVVSGSKDTQQPIKLWDPRTGTSLATLHAHKHTVMEVKWNQNGNWLLTASRDHLLKLYDIRQMKEELQTFKGHKKEATTVSWHPVNESLFSSGGSDGAIMFWLVGHDKEVGCIEEAHEGMVWSLAWHPLGHILASGSNDHSTKFWTRNRPGDRMRDKYNLNTLPVGISDEYDYEMDMSGNANLPGMGLEYGLPDHLKAKKPVEPDEEEKMVIPGLDFESSTPEGDKSVPRKKVPYAKPIPKSFEQAWETGLQPPSVGPMDPNGMPDQGGMGPPMGQNQMGMRGGRGMQGMRGNMRGMRNPLLPQPRGGGNMFQGNQGNGQDEGYGDENGRGFNDNFRDEQQQQFGGNFPNRGRGRGGNFGGQFGNFQDGGNKREWQDEGGGNEGSGNWGNNEGNWGGGGGPNKFQRMDNMGGGQNDNNFGGSHNRGRGFRGRRDNRGSPRGGFRGGRGNRGGQRWNRGGNRGR